MAIKNKKKVRKNLHFMYFRLYWSPETETSHFLLFIYSHMSLVTMLRKTAMIALSASVFAIAGITAFSSVSAQNVWTVGWGGSSFLNNNNGTDRAAGIDVVGAGQNTGESGLMDVIRSFINYALGLIAFILFAMLLYGGYKMIVAGGDDEAYKEGLKILKNGAIGVAFIAISWLAVQFIFAVIGMITG